MEYFGVMVAYIAGFAVPPLIALGGTIYYRQSTVDVFIAVGVGWGLLVLAGVLIYTIIYGKLPPNPFNVPARPYRRYVWLSLRQHVYACCFALSSQVCGLWYTSIYGGVMFGIVAFLVGAGIFVGCSGSFLLVILMLRRADNLRREHG